MTIAKPAHVEARRLALQYLDTHPGQVLDADLDPAEVGIVGDSNHQRGGSSYHLGKSDLRPDSYTIVESPRDRRGLDEHASAIDVGWFRVTTRRGTFDLRHFSRWLVGLCAAGDPDTADIREVIYSLDGRTVKRWDRLRRRSTGDSSHLTHTHVSEFRDASGARMLRLITRYLIEIGLLGGDDMTFFDEVQLEGRTGAQLIKDLWHTNYHGNAGDVEQSALARIETALASLAGQPASTVDPVALAAALAADPAFVEALAGAVARREAAADRARADVLDG